jgi:histone-binding protein RBBP4
LHAALADTSECGLPADIEDGPPELLFMHGGHTSRPTDLSWSPSEKWHVATTSEDNVLQVWQPSRTIYAADDVVIEVDDLE